jgi:hypothetical protein
VNQPENAIEQEEEEEIISNDIGENSDVSIKRKQLLTPYRNTPSFIRVVSD